MVSSPSPGPAGQIQRHGSSILQSFGALLIVVLMARPFDVFLVGLHIPLVICAAAILAVAATGAVRGLNTSTGRLIALFVGWVMLTTPFSIWKGGSAQYLENYVMLLVVLFLTIAEGPRDLKAVQKLMKILGVSVCLAVIVLHAVGQKGGPEGSVDYRSGGAGMFGNEGEFALLIGFVLPFWVFTASSVANRLFRTVLLSGSLYLVWLLVMTATRSAVIALIPVCILTLARLSMAKRLAMISVATIFCVAITVAAPERILKRLASVVTGGVENLDNSGAATLSEATESAMERKELFWDAAETMLRNPVFGVGAGNFAEYRYTVLTKDGKARRWFPAHNTYMQIGAECGVPGLIIYIAMVLSVFGTIRAVGKRFTPQHPEWNRVRAMTFCLNMSLLFFAVMSAFQNCDHYPHLFVIAGLAAALARVTKEQAAPAGYGFPAAQPALAWAGNVRRSVPANYRTDVPTATGRIGRLPVQRPQR